ncbi:MAG: carbohydrate kinase family protein [Gemmatimonadetes bacterium]|nr:carbohydrate kinase family protein [Gemmatimonadota bacterium]
MPRLGVLGTIVWDRIYARDGWLAPVEEWGGISYALAALAAARPPEWEVVPIIKVGSDLEGVALQFLGRLPGMDLETGIRVVPEPNNRVELRYQDGARRCERLTGGVPAWRWAELAPAVEGLDALYINFISGFELTLETATTLRLAFPGAVYADLHSLLLGVDAGGYRVPRVLAAWREWLRCFDAVQVNEQELACLAGAWGDPWHFAAEVVGDELRLLLVTLGPRGAAYIAAPAFQPEPRSWRTRGRLPGSRALGTPGAVRSERIGLDAPAGYGDPTGCGDVWGATCFARLLSGQSLEASVRAANRAAARNVEHRGATGLDLFLQGRIAT